MKAKEFKPLEGEKIIEEIKPMPALKKYFFLKWLVSLFAVFVFIGAFLFAFSLSTFFLGSWDDSVCLFHVFDSMAGNSLAA